MAEEDFASASASWRSGCIVAIGLGFATVAAFYVAVFAVFGWPRRMLPLEEWPILLFQVLIAAAPFGILARRGVRAKLPWLVAAVLTVCLWSAFFYSVWLAARLQTGANIGMGLLLLASPFIIAGAALMAAKLTDAR